MFAYHGLCMPFSLTRFPWIGFSLQIESTWLIFRAFRGLLQTRPPFLTQGQKVLTISSLIVTVRQISSPTVGYQGNYIVRHRCKIVCASPSHTHTRGNAWIKRGLSLTRRPWDTAMQIPIARATELFFYMCICWLCSDHTEEALRELARDAADDVDRETQGLCARLSHLRHTRNALQGGRAPYYIKTPFQESPWTQLVKV